MYSSHDELLGGMGRAQPAQVVHVRLAPVGFAIVSNTVSKQEHAELLFGAGAGLGGVRACAAQVAHGFIAGIRYVDGNQFAGPVQTRQFAGITLVGLHAVACRFGNLGGGHDDTVVSELTQASGQHKTGGSGFVCQGDFRFGDAELLAQFYQAAFSAQVRASPFAV